MKPKKLITSGHTPHRSTKIRLLSFAISIFFLTSCVAPFAVPQVVYANWVTRTIGALITSLALQSGAANIDTNYLNYVNDPNNTVMQIEIPNDGGVTSLPADLASQIDSALESAPVGVQRTVADMTTTQADIISLQDYIQNNGTTAGDTLPQMQPATAGQNIAASAQQLQETGTVQPAIGGQVVGLFAGMAPTVWNWLSSTRNANMYHGELLNLYKDGKITEEQLNDALYRYDNKLLEKYKTANNGVDINTTQKTLDKLQNNGTYCYIDSHESSLRYTEACLPSGVYACKFTDNDTAAYYNSTSTSKTYYQRIVSTFGENRNYSSKTLNRRSFSTGYSLNGSDTFNYHVFQNQQEAVAYFDNGGTIQNKSPSIVSPNGQLTANLNFDPTLNLNYYTTNQAPTYNYNNYSMEPVDLNEYSQFAQSIQQQIANDTPQEQISEAIEQYVEQHISAAPIPTVAPPPPVVPDQPNPSEKPTNTTEQNEENEEIMTTPELKDKFPFCIPWDIYYAFALLEDEREAPHLQFELDLGPAGVHEIDIDFAEWDDIAALLRTLELLGFIIALAVASKHLIGGS